MAIIEQVATNMAELVSLVTQTSRELGDVMPLWFRGISCSEYGLQPKLMRDGKTENQVFDRESRLLTRFRQRSLPFWPSGYPQTSWEHMFAMQHYGLPTRLLDWSENLFVATYFALGPSSQHSHEGACVPVLWYMSPIRWNRTMPPLSEYGDDVRILTTADNDYVQGYEPETTRKRPGSPVALYGTHNSERIVAQRGTFVVWGGKSNTMEDVALTHNQQLLWRVKMLGERADLVADLRNLGFTETMIYPELSHLALELTRSEEWR